MERLFEKLLYSARWIMAPIYLGLSFVLLALVSSFSKSVAYFTEHIFD